MKYNVIQTTEGGRISEHPLYGIEILRFAQDDIVCGAKKKEAPRFHEVLHIYGLE